MPPSTRRSLRSHRTSPSNSIDETEVRNIIWRLFWKVPLFWGTFSSTLDPGDPCLSLKAMLCFIHCRNLLVQWMIQASSWWCPLDAFRPILAKRLDNSNLIDFRCVPMMQPESNHSLFISITDPSSVPLSLYLQSSLFHNSRWRICPKVSTIPILATHLAAMEKTGKRRLDPWHFLLRSNRLPLHQHQHLILPPLDACLLVLREALVAKQRSKPILPRRDLMRIPLRKHSKDVTTWRTWRGMVPQMLQPRRKELGEKMKKLWRWNSTLAHSISIKACIAELFLYDASDVNRPRPKTTDPCLQFTTSVHSTTNSVMHNLSKHIKEWYECVELQYYRF